MKKKMAISLAIILFMMPNIVLGEELTIDSSSVGSEHSLEIEESYQNNSLEIEKEEETGETSGSLDTEKIVEETTSIELEQYKETSIEEEVAEENEEETLTNLFVTIVQEDGTLWKEIDKEQVSSTKELLYQTFKADKLIKSNNGKEYFLLVDYQEQIVGYVLKSTVKETNGAQGVWRRNNEFVVLKNKTVKVYQNFDWKEKIISNEFFEQPLHAQGVYRHFNGKNYYSLFSNQGIWQGYVCQDDVIQASGRQGIWYQENQYVIVSRSNYPIYHNFNWTVKNNTSKRMNETLHVKGYYKHFNGSIYYSLYNAQNVWQGYVNKDAVRNTSGPQGDFIKTNKYITIVNKNYPTYNSFNWKIRHGVGSLHQKTFKVKGYYKHVNGSIYYSLYDYNNKWYGYVNKNAVKESSGQQGAYIASGEYGTVTRTNYDLWQNFNWKKKGKSNLLYQKTYQIKGKYNHYNGSTYYSLYDNKGKWYGYINKNGVTVAQGQQGIWLSSNQQGIITKKGYEVWSNFNWLKRSNTDVMYNKKYRVKGMYNHFNGSRYYSLYDDRGNWQGYLNANAIGFGRRVSTFLGTTDEKVVNHLKSHEFDSFYLGTPYRSVLKSSDPNYVMSPKGKPNWFGPGMNCAGFIGYALRASGGDLNKVTQVSNQWGGPGNAYNWRNALTKNTDYLTFNSINGLVSSGKAKKGDIIYLEANHSLPNPDPHIGFFWGNTGKQDKFFHSTWPATKISNIYSGTPYSKVYLFPL